jgi:hypothetical protein
MWNLLASGRIRANVLALQANAERAGCALGCAYWSTDEFEAAVIRSRRASLSGWRRHWRGALYLGAAAFALALVFRII